MQNKELLSIFEKKPSLYAKSTAPFWDDEHISKGMLDAHLAVNVEAASRKYNFILQSAAWIKKEFLKSDETTNLLDLGCGPGLYTELFCKDGFNVTGIDFSKRSINYSIESAKNKNLPIEYYYKNYLDIDYDNIFDVITLIYCDFGVLAPKDRTILLKKIKKALKPTGKLILDGFTKQKMNSYTEGSTIKYLAHGFWSPDKHLCMQNNYLYTETNNSVEQYIIITEDDFNCYNNWNQFFTANSLKKELQTAGFKEFNFYDNVAGAQLTDTSDTICVVAS